MHEMLTVPTDVCNVCLSVSLSVSLSICLSRGLNWWRRVQCTPHAVCAGSCGAAFVKLLDSAISSFSSA